MSDIGHTERKRRHDDSHRPAFIRARGAESGQHIVYGPCQQFRPLANASLTCHICAHGFDAHPTDEQQDVKP